MIDIVSLSHTYRHTLYHVYIIVIYSIYIYRRNRYLCTTNKQTQYNIYISSPMPSAIRILYILYYTYIQIYSHNNHTHISRLLNNTIHYISSPAPSIKWRVPWSAHRPSCSIRTRLPTPAPVCHTSRRS